MGRRIAMLALGATLAAGALHAEGAFDLVFRTGTLDGLPEGAELRYDGTGTLGAEEGWPQLAVDLRADDQVVVEREVGTGTPQQLGSFRASLGNPVAMMFLERTVNDVAQASGGSPVYIRNRIRDALASPGEVEEVTIPWQGATVPATQVVLRPFREDAHRAQLGGFADLEIRVVMSDAVPGWYRSLAAEAPAAGEAEAYASALTLAEDGP